MILGETLLNGLKEYGAEQIFGLPGDFILPFFKVIEDSNILPLYTLSHEPAVGFAADAAARFGSNLGVAVVTYGAGALNTINAVACAYAEKSPLVIISGAPGVSEGRSGMLLHHQTKSLGSQFEMFKEVTCGQLLLDNAKTAPEKIANLLRMCIDQSRPVYIELPRDMVFEKSGAVPLLQREPPNPEALSACVIDVLARLEAAKNPVIMVGVEVRRHGLEEHVATLANKLEIPVVTSFMGRGLLAGLDCPLAGSYIGLAGNPDISSLVETSDALLMLGVIVSDTNFGVSGRSVDLRKAIEVSDNRVKLGHHYYPDMPIADVIDELLCQSRPQKHCIEPVVQTYQHGLVVDEQKITPGDIVSGINDMFEANGPMIIAADIGDCLFSAMEIEHTQLAASGYYATMGFGVPAGLGIQAASGKRCLILVGDGGFQMTGWELGNCARYGWDPIVIVFNNRSWEMLSIFDAKANCTKLDDWHYADIAPSIGGDGYRVTTRAELSVALNDAYNAKGRFQLIEVMLDRGEVSGTLKQYATVLHERAQVKKEKVA